MRDEAMRAACVGAVLAIGLLGAAGCSGDASGDASADGVKVVTPKVQGTISESVLISGDSEARQRLKVTNVWCRWNDGEVEMGAKLRNGMATHITVYIQPNYRIARGGLHGDGLGSQKDIGVDADATRVWSSKLGTPKAVKGTPTITECAPEITIVELG